MRQTLDQCRYLIPHFAHGSDEYVILTRLHARIAGGVVEDHHDVSALLIGVETAVQLRTSWDRDMRALCAYVN